MALPTSYTCFETYVKDCLQFLKDYDWIYNYPNTHILVYKIFDKIPRNWLEHFSTFTTQDLNNLALGYINESAPGDLQEFIQKVNRLKPHIQTSYEPVDFSFPKNISMSDKKKHEITCLLPLVRSVCDESNVKEVLDIGCGLGYLPQLLNEKYNYKVFGIEGNESNVKLAKGYQEKYYPHSVDHVKYFHHYITKDSLEFLKETIPDDSCITGLHACADLSITILRLFAEMPSSRCLIVMPCCYHRLTLKHFEEGSEEVFDNFPSSDVLKNMSRTFRANLFLRRPFLRLAAQQSNQCWRNMDDAAHDVRAKNCLFRAILQEVAEEGGYNLRRLKRKSGTAGTTSKDFIPETFANNLPATHSFTSCNRPVDYSEIRASLLEKWNNYRSRLALTEALTSLQTFIQDVCENLVLLDRVEYLRQKGIRAVVYKVTDETLSPRCFALVAIKH